MQPLSLKELAGRVGMRPRTVRSYIEKGLLPGPDGSGRYAHYGFRHLERLKAIKVLREIDGLSLEETRRRLLGLGEREVRQIADRLDAWRARPEAELLAELPARLEEGEPTAPEASAMPMGDRPSRFVALRHRAPREPLAQAALALRPLMAPSRRAAFRLQRHEGPHAAPGEETVPRRARAEPLTRIEITPDIDLVVRGVRDEEQIRRLERIADHLRHVLLRGVRKD